LSKSVRRGVPYKSRKRSHLQPSLPAQREQWTRDILPRGKFAASLAGLLQVATLGPSYSL
jgi:hypothetical protein